MENNKKEKLKMNWWRVWQYFLFPFGILYSIIAIAEYNNIDFEELNFFEGSIVIVNFAFIILLCVTYIMFLRREKYSFSVFITYLFLYPAWNIFVAVFSIILYSENMIDINGAITPILIACLISYLIIYSIWIFPNYIYFKKRKEFFIKEEERQYTNQEQENKQLNNIEKVNNNEIEENKEEGRKKYCIKCGKIIDDEWIYCNYCGNKLK